ncbi:MAG: hypothetical protein ACMUEM_04330 [Flavobacteriales bacterium AspAUS03]
MSGNTNERSSSWPNIKKKEGQEIRSLCTLTFISKQDQLSYIRYEYNSVILESAFSEKKIMVGIKKGNKSPVSAVLSNISFLTYQYKYEFKKDKRKI